MAENVFKDYRTKIVREGIVKSILLGGSIGLFALALTVLFSWFFGFKEGLYVGLGLLAACTAAFSPVFYYKRYRPTAKAVAKRVDELGLEERALTMVELENDDSYIAARQREDTHSALRALRSFAAPAMVFSVALIVTAAIALLLGASTLTVGALYAADVIPDGMSLVTEEKLPDTYVITYAVGAGGGGSIVMYTDDWENEQSVLEEIIVTEGEDAPAVLAVEDENYLFVGWSDGVTEAYRQDRNLSATKKVEAIFMKLEDEADGPEKAPFDVPQIYREPSENDDNKEPDPNAPPWLGESEGQHQPGDTNGAGPGEQMQSAAGNQVYDGQTFYGDPYEDEHNSAMDRLGSDDSMSGDLKDGISDYYDSIEQNSSQTGEGEGGEDLSGEGGN